MLLNVLFELTEYVPAMSGASRFLKQLSVDNYDWIKEAYSNGLRVILRYRWPTRPRCENISHRTFNALEFAARI